MWTWIQNLRPSLFIACHLTQSCVVPSAHRSVLGHCDVGNALVRLTATTPGQWHDQRLALHCSRIVSTVESGRDRSSSHCGTVRSINLKIVTDNATTQVRPAVAEGSRATIIGQIFSSLANRPDTLVACVTPDQTRNPLLGHGTSCSPTANTIHLSRACVVAWQRSSMQHVE